MTEDIFETPSSTPNFQTELAEQLAELVPEALADGKIDVLKLQELLAQDAAETSERFGLFWPGKQRALRVAQMPTTATLRPQPEKSKNWDTTKNVFIEGDNLEVLKILQKHYHGKIKMIYIDPPYNTGKDFVYPDNFKEGLENYLEWTRQVNDEGKKISTNSETEGRYHSNWLNMMYPRLKLARNLLSDDGVIFISINDHEYDNLKKVCNEIFGEGNVIATLIWKNKNGGGNDSKYVAVEHEYVLMVARNQSNLPRLFVDHSDDYLARYKEADSEGRFYWDTFKRKSGKQYYPVTAPDGTVIEFDELGNRISWLRSADRFQSDLESGEVRFVRLGDKWSVQFKQREPEGKKPRSILTEEGTTSSGSAEVLNLFGKNVFDNPKPTALIAFLANIVTREDDVILDFFAGSSTTAHAIMKLNARDGGSRKYIQVQLPEPTADGSVAQAAGYKTVADVSRTRIDLAASALAEETSGMLLDSSKNTDVGYRYFKLTDSGYAKWQISGGINPDDLEQRLFDLRDSAADGLSQEVLLYEILLKQGYSLTESVSLVSISGAQVFSIADGLLLAYLDQNIKLDLEAWRSILASNPAKLIVLEDSFQGDDEVKTNLVQLCKSKNIEFWTA